MTVIYQTDFLRIFIKVYLDLQSYNCKLSVKQTIGGQDYLDAFLSAIVLGSICLAAHKYTS